MPKLFIVNMEEETKMKIRKASTKDFDFLWKILSGTPELQSDAEGDTYDKEWLKSVIENKRENLVMISEEKNKVTGFLIAHYLPSVRQTIINDVYVFPEFRNRGIASKLTEECEKESKKLKHKYVTALVRSNNKKMLKFKEKIGYKKGNLFYFFEKRLK